jgi:hypothetical protein
MDPLFIRAPKDYKLLIFFRDHRPELERIGQMMEEDSIWDIGRLSTFSWPWKSAAYKNISDERKKEYKQLLSKIDSSASISRDSDKIRIIFSGGGLSTIGPEWAKGIEYISGNPSREGIIVDNLDHPTSLAVGNIYLRQIEPGWYLFFQNTD